MRTDWVLIGRLARELEERLAGARVDDAGLLADGRIALTLRRRGAPCALAIDLFATPPRITLEDEELGVLEEPGFVRALAKALRGMTLRAVASRRYDRLIRMTFATRSRFGVGDELELMIELVPRFGNAVLVKNGSIVAAYKEFSPAQNARRAVQGGAPYALPPLPPNPITLDPPALPEDAVVLDAFAAMHADDVRNAESERSERYRNVLLRRVDERERKLRGELEALARKRDAASRRDDLRVAGEEIFARLHELTEAEREEAKERAAALFAAYKKLGQSLPHVGARERTVNAMLQTLETLRWEAERSAPEDLADTQAAVDAVERRPARKASQPPRKRKRRMLELRTPRGSRVVVGRSPVENADLTFRVARPNDLWFHAQNTPGAHVILSRDDRGGVPEEDLEIAASLAAFYSKGQKGASTPVDYTQRKHVRKQRDAPPGLVWYTHAKTILAQPYSMESLREDPAAGRATMGSSHRESEEV